MTEWTKEHPIATHIINLSITLLFIVISFFLLKYFYGDKITEVHENTIIIMDIVTKL